MTLFASNSFSFLATSHGKNPAQIFKPNFMGVVTTGVAVFVVGVVVCRVQLTVTIKLIKNMTNKASKARGFI